MDVTVIEASALPDMLARAEELWEDSRATANTRYVPEAPTFRALCENTTAKMPKFQNRMMTPKQVIAWVEACTNNPQILTNRWVRDVPCDFTGWTVGTNKDEVTISTIITDTFAIPYKIYDNLFTPQELFNEGWLKAVKGIIEKANSLSVAKLATFAGLNDYHGGMLSDGGTGPTSWKITDFPYKNLFPESFGSMLRMVQRRNDMVNPFIIAGEVMSTLEDVQGDLEKFKFGRWDVFSDMIDFPEQDLEDDLFLVSQGAVGVFNTYNYPTSQENIVGSNFNETHISRALPSIYNLNGQPQFMDITTKFEKREIAENQYGNLNVDNRCEFVYTYNLEYKLEIKLNPTSCLEGRTGVIRFHSDDTSDLFLTPMKAVRTIVENV